MKYKARVIWSQEEEDILTDALQYRTLIGKRLDLEEVSSQNQELYKKYLDNPKHIANKLMSLQKKPTKYKPRSKWTKEEEIILRDAINFSIENDTKISYKQLSHSNPELYVKYNSDKSLLKNKVTSMKQSMFNK